MVLKNEYPSEINFRKPERVSIIECPRDAMQGWKHFIPTKKKIEYLNFILSIGFDTIDFGSFVSPKAIPQLADTHEVLKGLTVDDTRSPLLAIVANVRGAEAAVNQEKISFLGFPFSISETFQKRNTHASITDSLKRVDEIQDLCLQKGKVMVVYLSMAFGNPYGDPYNSDILLHWADEMISRNIHIVSLADTVGLAQPKQIFFALKTLIDKYPAVQTGVHLHSSVEDRKEKLQAALDAGCTRIDGALGGIGGCPMAGSELVGNMATEYIISFLEEAKIAHGVDQQTLGEGLELSRHIFI
ncbi:MAG: hydroxymethylglutaryl-CoA lyase [Flavisolibacter sp.]